MAILTGYKTARGPTGVAARGPASGGQANPVIVFDEVNVGDGVPSEDEDAAAHSERSVDVPAEQQQQAAPVAAPAAQPCKPPPPGPAKTVAATQRPANNCPPAPQTPPDSPAKSAAKTSPAAAAAAKTATAAAKTAARPSRPLAAGSLAAKTDEGDNVSVSMLAIDCMGSGKAPRQPARSPLMALFRGQPRQSVRRLYTDRDQFEIEWANLSLEVQRKWYQKVSLSSLLLAGQQPGGEGPAKCILNTVDGRIRSGEITAVLGPSGAGKTSLLNSLFGKYRHAVQGSIRVTGAPSKKHLTVCTIPQSDFLIGYLTTEECLWFGSRLKNCDDDFNHDRNIERVIELLGLQRCRHTRINKLSGGQYKRVSIAQEMLSSPDILVLDEPTSGLDSLTCYRTVKVLRDLVEASKAHNLVNPMSIILTIHQPHREVLDLFHSVYVMAVGGQTLYQGPPGDMEQCIDKHSGVAMPAEGYNPASFMVELASEEYGREPIEKLVARQRLRFQETTKHSYSYDFSLVPGQLKGAQAERQQLASFNSAADASSDASNHKSSPNGSQGANSKHDSTVVLFPLENPKSASGGAPEAGQASRDVDSRIMTPRSGKNSDGVFWRHTSLMAKRCFLSNTRDPLLCSIRVGAHIFIPLVVALIYGPRMGVPNGCPFYKPEINLLEYASMGVAEIQEKHDDIRIQFQNVGLHFMVYYVFGLCMLAFTAISFPLIMHVLVKEIRNGWYSLASFIMGKMFAELPMAVLLPPISVGIIYTMTGQPASYLQWRYFVQSLLLILIVMIGEAKGLVFGAICMNSMQTAVFAASVSTVPFILLSGFLIRIYEIPYLLQHLAKFSYFKHAVEALIITRYGYGMCPCDQALIPPGGTPRIIGIPPQIMSLTDYYIGSFVEPAANQSAPAETNVPGNNRTLERIVGAATSLAPELQSEPLGAATAAPAATNTRKRPRRAPARAKAHRQSASSSTAAPAPAAASPATAEPARRSANGVFFDKLASLLTRANAMGYLIETCDDVEPFAMKDMQLKDHMLPPLIGYLFVYIFVLKFISYFIVEICVKLKL